jgi:DNA-binding CsgD family transcriptional regulator
MNILIIAYLVSAFVSFESALFVYRINRLSKLNRLYTVFAGSNTLYSIVMIFFLLSPDITYCWFWYRSFTVLACVFQALELRFFIELAGIRVLTRNRIFLLLIYVVPLLFAMLTVSFLPVIKGFTRFQWGWGILVRKSVWTLIFYSYMMISNFICIGLAIYWRFQVKTSREKKMAGIILLSVLAGIFGLFQVFLPDSYTKEKPALIIHLYYVSCFLLLVFSIRFAIHKYGLMTITQANPAFELFEGMPEALFVINVHGRIIFLNEKARILTRSFVRESDTRNIFSLFASREILTHEIDQLAHSREPNRPVILTTSRDAGSIQLETTMYGVKNEISELIGIIMIVREAGGIPGLQKQHRLSSREIEILLLLCNGLSSQEIAQDCEITLLTAKTHIHNIYIKTGLKNRVELSNLLNKHL